MYKSKRLLLRNWTNTDLGSLDAIFGDPLVMRYSDTGVLSTKDQRTWLQTQISSDAQHGSPLNLAIEHRQSGQAIGYLSLSKDLTRVGPNDAELGIRLSKAVWGHGFATEAIRTAMDAVKPEDRIVAIVDPNNLRSLKLLERAGLVYECDVMFPNYDYPDHLYVQHTKT